MIMKKAFRRCMSLIVCALVFLPLSSFAGSINHLVAFGDSLSDSGNLYKATKAMGALNPSVPAVPKTPPYWEGHFSNGYTWVEHLAQKMGLDLNNDDEFDDNAFGGSWIEGIAYSHETFPPNLSTQVDWYIRSLHGKQSKPHHLFTIWDGANDYLKGRSDIDGATTRSVAIIKLNVERLINEAGAENFLLLNLPDLGRTPYANILFPNLKDQLSQLTLAHNTKLSAALAELRVKYPTKKIVLFDIYSAFNTLLDTGKINGVSFEVTNFPCYTGGYTAGNDKAKKAALSLKQIAKIDLGTNPSLKQSYYHMLPFPVGVCGQPNSFAFWDTLHTTTAVNTVIANMAKNLLVSNEIIE